VDIVNIRLIHATTGSHARMHRADLVPLPSADRPAFIIHPLSQDHCRTVYGAAK